MLFNFVKVSLRYFSKNRFYTFINVFGLALGIGCFLLLSLFLDREFSFDEFQSKKELVYQVYDADSAQVDGPFSPITGPTLGKLATEQVPEVVNYARFVRGPETNLLVGEESYKTIGIYGGDAGAFSMFDIDMIAGAAPDSLLEKKTIYLSKRQAEIYFGDAAEAIGKVIDFPEVDQFVVRGVFDDMRKDSHLTFQVLISFEYVSELLFYASPFSIDVDFNKWKSVSAFLNYIEVQPGADIDLVASKIKEISLSNDDPSEYTLVRVDDIYLSEWATGYFEGRVGDMKVVKLYIAVGVLLLVIALLNYMNLSTARFSKRIKEVGVRRTVGGHRNQLVLQFLIESISITFLSVVLGIVMAEAVMPAFNNYTGKPIDINYGSAGTYIYFIGIVLAFGLIAGLYPSLHLSKLKPSESILARSTNKEKSTFRRVLVGVQFAICLSLISATFILFSQHQHMKNIDLGFNVDELVTLELKGKKLEGSAEAIKSEIEKIPTISGISTASIAPISGMSVSIGSSVKDSEGEEIQAMLFMGEEDIFDLIEVEIIEGQNISDLPESERSKAVLVNETFFRKAGWETWQDQKAFGDNKVVGIVKDFITTSAKEAIKPMLFKNTKGVEQQFFFRIDGNITATLTKVQNILMDFDADYVFDYEFVDETFAAKYEEEQRLSQVFGLFSLLTIVIAGLGILGLSIFIAESRIKEIGIRKVLGAKIGQLIWMLNSSITLLVLVVAIIVVPAVYYFTQNWLENFAYRIDLGVSHFLLPLAMLLGILWSILFYQAYRSAKSNPVNALRTDG